MDADLTKLQVLFDQIFSSKPEDKRRQWLKVLSDEEFETVGDLKKASDETWKSLSLPLAIKDAIKVALKDYGSTTASTATTTTTKHEVKKIEDTRPITQIDMIVFDVSSSMRSKAFDPLNTRLGCAKTLFHSMVDKLVGHELPHLLGLVLFGENVKVMPFVRDYEAFHDTLGDADAIENSTKLWDAIKKAGEEIIEYRKVHHDKLSTTEPCMFRIFCLTDGEDNASTTPFWKVAQFLQENTILLDAFPLATKNEKLQAMTLATGGMCLNVSDMLQGVQLFEREAILHVASRESPGDLIKFNSEQELMRHGSPVKVVEDIKTATPQAMNAKVMKKEDLQKIEATAASSSSTPAANKRLLAELREFTKSPLPGMHVFPTADDMFFWKVLMQGPAGTPYEGGIFALYFKYPSDYPFKPPSVRFVTKIYHCNINNDGKVCLDILAHSWSPALTINKVLLALESLLREPNAADALDTVKANVYSDNKQLYEQYARQWTKDFASASLQEIKAQYQIEDS